MTLGEYLKELRLSKGLTQKELAEKLKITHNTVCYYENDHQKPSLKMIRKYSEVFGVEINMIVRLKYDK